MAMTIRSAASSPPGPSPFAPDVFAATDRIGCHDGDGVQKADLERVAELRQSLLERQTIYSYCASFYGLRYYALTIPSIVITIAISIVAAVWPYSDKNAEVAGRIIISVLGALVTVITACLSLFQYQAKMDIFFSASQQIDGMVSRLSFVTKYRMGDKLSRCEVQGIIQGIEDKLNEIRTKVPPIPNDLWLAGTREEEMMIQLRKTRVEQRKLGWTDNQVKILVGETGDAPADGSDDKPKTPQKQGDDKPQTPQKQGEKFSLSMTWRDGRWC